MVTFKLSLACPVSSLSTLQFCSQPHRACPADPRAAGGKRSLQRKQPPSPDLSVQGDSCVHTAHLRSSPSCFHRMSISWIICRVSMSWRRSGQHYRGKGHFTAQRYPITPCTKIFMKEKQVKFRGRLICIFKLLPKNSPKTIKGPHLHNILMVQL